MHAQAVHYPSHGLPPAASPRQHIPGHQSLTGLSFETPLRI